MGKKKERANARVGALQCCNEAGDEAALEVAGSDGRTRILASPPRARNRKPCATRRAADRPMDTNRTRAEHEHFRPTKAAPEECPGRPRKLLGESVCEPQGTANALHDA